MNDDEMLAAVLEMSRHDAGPNIDEPTSSPDTGFGDADAQELAQHLDLLEEDKASGGTETVQFHCQKVSLFRFFPPQFTGGCLAVEKKPQL